MVHSCCCIAFCALQLSSFITPSGLKLSRQTGERKGRVKGKVPFFLAEYWNRCVLALPLAGHRQGAMAGSAAALCVCLKALTSRMSAPHPTGAPGCHVISSRLTTSGLVLVLLQSQPAGQGRGV